MADSTTEQLRGMIARYLATPPSLTDKDACGLFVDAAGNLKIILASNSGVIIGDVRAAGSQGVLLQQGVAGDGYALNVGGGVASGATDAGNPIKIGGVYNTTPPVFTNGQRGDAQIDVNGNLLETLATLIAGEDLANNVMKVEVRGTPFSITTQTTTTVKSGAGFIYQIEIPTPVANATVKIYDNTAGSGTVLLDTITLPSVLISDGPIVVPLNKTFSTGCTIVTAGATMSVSGSVR